MNWFSYLPALVALFTSFAKATNLKDAQRQVTYYSNTKMATERFYLGDQKVGTHRTWYPSGQLKSRSSFSLPNTMELFEDWHDNGKLARQIRFENGMEVSTKVYRRSGQIYINRVIRNGRMYGLPGGKACFRVNKNGATL